MSSNHTYIAFNKPFMVLSQFTAEQVNDRTLAEFNLPAGVYAAGRLDKDSEGLLILTDDGEYIHRTTMPKFDKIKTYWVQVEGMIDDQALALLQSGVVIQGKKTLPAQARVLVDIEVPPRDPPIRFRANIPTCWIELKIKEGRNRQVRRMTAAVGFPTLRLLRVAIGAIELGDLRPGEWRSITPTE